MPGRGYPEHSVPSSFDDDDKFMNENGWTKVGRKLREEPLIPLGCALTVAALFNATRALRRGDSASAQRMFRARVAAQGFTLLAVVAGGMYYSADRAKSAELRQLQEQQSAEEKRAKWIRELEVRDEEEKALRARLEARAMKSLEKSAPDAKEASVFDKLGNGWGGKTVKQDEKGEEGSTDEADEKKRNPRSSLGALGDIVGTRKPSDSDKN